VGNSTTRDITAKAIYTNDWFRVNGANGIYWQDYAGGWQMTDSIYIRSYNSKPVLLPYLVDQDNTDYYLNPKCLCGGILEFPHGLYRERLQDRVAVRTRRDGSDCVPLGKSVQPADDRRNVYSLGRYMEWS
ncbi:MAG: hypothetical protein HY221_01655, partial [Candidatus Sungbacteria bacterium]|nr:hypothetical protein [Candidatus Sungbacteria bacterium]